MSVKGRPIPAARTLVESIERSGREAMGDARRDVVPIVASETPRVTGRVAAALRPRIARTSTGVSMTVGAPRGAKHGQATVADVLRWLTRGTGEYRVGPGPKFPITPKVPGGVMVLPGGKRVRRVRGQHPNPFVDRIKARATPKVDAVLRTGATTAARAAERLFR